VGSGGQSPVKAALFSVLPREMAQAEQMGLCFPAPQVRGHARTGVPKGHQM